MKVVSMWFQTIQDSAILFIVWLTHTGYVNWLVWVLSITHFFPYKWNSLIIFLVLPFFFKTQLCMFSSGSIFGFLFERYIPTVWILALYLCSYSCTYSVGLELSGPLSCIISLIRENYNIFSLAITVCMIYWTEIDTPYIFL